MAQDSLRHARRPRAFDLRPAAPLYGELRLRAALLPGAAGALGRLLGGWQVNAFLTFQSGAPFTVLNGSDPTGALNGIDGLVGNSIRPNLNTTLDVSRMSIIELLQAGGASLFAAAAFPASGHAARSAMRAATSCAPTGSTTSTSAS